jgi:hypothetical protein
MKHFILLAICAAVISLGGCANESKFPEATGKANIRAINAIATSPSFNFLIEERSLGTVDYKIASAPASWDDLEYTFNFQVVLAGNLTPTRVASQILDVEANKDYTFIISGAIASPDITLWESDSREWAGTETVFESQFGHTAASRGAVDVYLAFDGVAPVFEERIGTLAFGEVLPVTEFEEGNYVLTVTTAGDVSDVLFVTNPILLSAQSSFLFSIFDADANEFAPVSLALYNLNGGGSSLLADTRSNPTARFFHASKDFGATDIYIDDPITTPFVEAQNFGDVSVERPIPAGLLPLTIDLSGHAQPLLRRSNDRGCRRPGRVTPESALYRNGRQNQHHQHGDESAGRRRLPCPDRRAYRRSDSENTVLAGCRRSLAGAHRCQQLRPLRNRDNRKDRARGTHTPRCGPGRCC